MSDSHDEASPEAGAKAPANRLAGETSAYLRQHMHNPVDWYPWGPEALARARDEERPLLISIGYSACHWCHVMERESFEDPATAELMNGLFVNVKVDREERPDVDQIYMDAVVRLTGHGGWPLTVFCAPDGRPFYGGTYFPPQPRQGMPSFRQVLTAMDEAWRFRRDEVDLSARRILDALRHRPDGPLSETPGSGTARRAALQMLRSADPEHGGFGEAPKFPTPTNLELLLAAVDVLPERKADEALDHVAFTAREMARRGLYDQLGGGFHRYCVDGHWGVPHFEKMLYDQGLLLRVYGELWRRTRDEDFAWPIRETAHYLRTCMTGPEGGLYASQDADSEGEEGLFYVWTPEQVSEVLGQERGEAFCRAYAVRPGGNFEGRNVLWDLPREERALFGEERAALLAARAERIPPATDRKRVAAWNAYAISGLAYAGSLLADETCSALARETADFVLGNMTDETGGLLRVWNEGQAHIPAFLDDHGALLAACLDLHRAGAGHRYLLEALHLAKGIAERFYDAGEGELYMTPADGERLVHRPRSDHDGATPHSAGLAALGLLRVATLSGENELRAIAEQVVAAHGYVLERAPHAHPTLSRVALAVERGLSVAVIVGDPDAPESAALAAAARRALAPEDAVLVSAPGAKRAGLDPSWLAGREPVDGRSAAYVCRGATCSLPVTDPEELVPLPEEGPAGRKLGASL